VLSNKTRLVTCFALAIFLDIKEIWTSSGSLLHRLDGVLDRYTSSAKATGEAWKIRNKHIHPSSYTKHLFRSAFRLLRPAFDIVPQSDGEMCLQTELRSFLQQSPLTCGNIELVFRVAADQSTMVDVDKRGIVKTALHFYNAARVRGDLKEEWPDMELLLDRFRDQDLFLGPRPDTLEKSLSILRLVAGLPIDLGMLYEGRAHHIAPKEQAFFADTHHPFLDAISIITLKNWPSSTQWKMLQAIGEMLQRDPNFVLRGVRGALPDVDKILKQTRTSDPSMLDTLQAIDRYLAFELPHLEEIDFLSLERSCCDLLRKIKEGANLVGYDRPADFMSDIQSTPPDEEHLALLTRPLLAVAMSSDGITKSELDARVKAGWDMQESNRIAAKMSMPYNHSVSCMARHISRQGDIANRRGWAQGHAGRIWAMVGNAKMLL
jgi:hypothetical protein